MSTLNKLDYRDLNIWLSYDSQLLSSTISMLENNDGCDVFGVDENWVVEEGGIMTYEADKLVVNIGLPMTPESEYNKSISL